MPRGPENIPPLVPGSNKLSASGWNAIRRLALDYAKLNFDPAHFIRMGQSISLRPQSGGSVTTPWSTTRADVGETKYVSVYPGSINSLIPTDIFDPLEITGTGTEYVVLTMTSTSGSPVSASLSIETTYPVPSATSPSYPPTACTDVVAVIEDGVVYPVRSVNLLATSREVFQETVANPAVGERQYIPWYRWEVEES